MEGRGQLEGNSGKVARVRTQCRTALPSNLARVNEAARKDRKARFTALLHHISVEALQRVYRRLRRNASAGVDGETVASYGKNLEAKLADLHQRVHGGSYKALPVRRAYIKKSDGSPRPLGIPALEDKIVQGAVAEVLGAIYEVDFLGYSYGFRPGRSPHDALKALQTALMTQKVNWVLDADVRNFFGSVDHEWLLRMTAHRVADKRVLRLISQWLKSGALEDGVWSESEQGTPQGSGVSPILANIFLHYVLDLWVQWWRKQHARGQVIIVRYCDDFVMGFQYEDDARRMMAELKERLAKFKLAFHEGKTRLIQFGRYAAERSEGQGERRPRTFSFLGFTHYWGKAHTGRFLARWKTDRQRLASKLKRVKEEIKRRMHDSMKRQHEYLCSVLRGHYQYYGVPGNNSGLWVFQREVHRLWFRALRRRGGKKDLTWDRFGEMLHQFPLPRSSAMSFQTFHGVARG